jgi:hypothetical protein
MFGYTPYSSRVGLRRLPIGVNLRLEPFQRLENSADQLCQINTRLAVREMLNLTYIKKKEFCNHEQKT